MLGIKASITSYTFDHWGRVHCHVPSLTWHHSYHGPTPGNEGAKFSILCVEPYVYYKIFKDNSGALELARLPKLCPRTKHINVCYHHFHKHVCKGPIKIFPIDTKDQIEDALTKALAQNDFRCHRHHMCGNWPLQDTNVRECYIISIVLTKAHILQVNFVHNQVRLCA